MTPTKRKLGVDFDDVLIDFIAHLLYFHNQKHNMNFSKEEVTTWDLHKIWNISEEESLKRVNDFVISHDHDQILPTEGAIEALKTLSPHFEFVIITARDKAMSDRAFHLINKHFGDMFSSVHFLYEHGEKKKTKGQLCKELGIDYFVDDSLTNVFNTNEAGIPTFLFDTPWNREVLPEGVQRIYSWAELTEILIKEIQ